MNTPDKIGLGAPYIDRLNSSIRENPLAAGLIGAGVAWMCFGGMKGFGRAANAAKNVAGKSAIAAANSGKAMANSLTKAIPTAANSLKDNISGIADSLASVAHKLTPGDLDEAVSNAGPVVSDGIGSVAAAGRESGAAIQERLSETLERQPLLLGAIGLAIGAGIAFSFATTGAENHVMGERGTAAREKLQDLTMALEERAKLVVSDIEDEAQRQALTPAAAKEAAAAIGEKVKTATTAGRNTVAERLAEN